METNGSLGIIAGSGKLPFILADSAHRRGERVVCVALRNEADPSLRDRVDRFHWCGVAKVGRLIRLFKKEGVDRAVMVGKVQKSRMYTPFRILRMRPDFTTFKIWYRRARDKSDGTLLGEFARELESKGIRVMDSSPWIQENLAAKGTLSRRNPSASEQKDIRFGAKIALGLGQLDVGQSVAVKEEAVIAVEAMEGTDAMIRRAGDLAGGGFVVVKMAKPLQDLRFDIPTIGPATIQAMADAGGRVLVVEANKTLMIDPDDLMAEANRLGICVVGVDTREMEG
ncbi:MAG: UDP-2,3-diacylglucosamine diphosphatase LpxI [Planctomycetota bacterium]|nr:UDP-2,3-diacylglucosamine diphosphatase LpxI [Planctomycetota bacterium]